MIYTLNNRKEFSTILKEKDWSEEEKGLVNNIYNYFYRYFITENIDLSKLYFSFHEQSNSDSQCGEKYKERDGLSIYSERDRIKLLVKNNELRIIPSKIILTGKGIIDKMCLLDILSEILPMNTIDKKVNLSIIDRVDLKNRIIHTYSGRGIYKQSFDLISSPLTLYIPQNVLQQFLLISYLD